MHPLRIWIVKYGELIPFGAGREDRHYFRAAELTRRLSKRGHQVVWWTGRFEHQTKQHLPDEGDTVTIPDGAGSEVRLLDSPGYASNVSVRRFYDHYIIGRRFREALEIAQVPDVILTSMPTPELASASAEFAKAKGIPLIVDVRDLWPDAIAQRMRGKFGYFPKWPLFAYERNVRFALKAADSVTAITRDCLTWAQQKGRRSAVERDLDRVFHLASRRTSIDPQRSLQIEAMWRARGLEAGSKRIFVWAGSLTNQAAANALLDAQFLLPESIRDRIQVVICGDGDLADKVQAVSSRLPHMIYPGYVSRDEVQFLYGHSNVGLLCYDNTLDFQSSFPNKFGEYLMHGLFVLTTIQGAIQREYGHQGFIKTTLPTTQAIVDAMRDCVIAPASAEMRSSAREVFARDFDSDLVYENFCDHIEQMGTSGK